MERDPLILVVDDDRSTRRLMTTALKKSGFEVVEAENGLRALEVFELKRPDLVLLDVVMPEMDGFETCRRIRTHPNGPSVPVVIITGSDDYDAIGKAYEAGATDFFAKPINRKILSERVRYMLRASATAAQLHQSRELLARAQAVAGMGSFFYEPGTQELQVSEEFKNIFGTQNTYKTYTWQNFWQKIHPGDQKILIPLLQKANTAGASFRQDIRTVDGRTGARFFMLQIDPETNSEGKVIRLTGIVQDITERKQAELLETDQNKVMQRIASKEPLKEILLDAAHIVERQRPLSLPAICQVKADQIQAMISQALPEQFCQSMAGTLLSTDNGTCAAAAYLGQPTTADNVATNSFWKNRRKEALAHGLYSSASVPIFSGTGQILGTVTMMRREPYHTSNADLALMERVANLVALAMEQNLLSQQLVFQAQHDPLTGLVNRGTLIHWMAQTLKKAARTSIFGAYMLIDLDRFKHINDSLGHHVGDLLLQEVAERLRQCVRESDVLSRVGGDEFVLVLPEIDHEDDVARAASRVLESFHSPFAIEGHKFPIEASIGIALFPRDATEGTALYKNADIAMYVAKNEGGNRFHFFDSKMHEAVVQRLQIENDLRKALERNEFELHYQPQLDLTSNKLMVMEALIRWNHPERGRIAPARFISVAEESRLIIPIGKWVLKEACRQNKLWQQHGLSPVRIAVNVSAVQFTETDFARTVQEALAETGMDPYWLEVEITETVVLKNMEKVCENLENLQDLGVTTTLDDFGTGYSSISYLTQMHLDGIKIDQSFIRDLEILPTLNESKNTHFVKAFATLAKNLKLHLVAEGVETKEQSRLLKQIGYTLGQGFLFSAPLPANEASAFLQKDA